MLQSKTKKQLEYIYAQQRDSVPLNRPALREFLGKFFHQKVNKCEYDTGQPPLFCPQVSCTSYLANCHPNLYPDQRMAFGTACLLNKANVPRSMSR